MNLLSKNIIKIGGYKMAFRNNSVTNLWQKVQQDSVVWGSLGLWITALVVLLLMLAMFSNA